MRYQFPDYLQAVYSDVLVWLDEMPDATGFRTAPFDLDADNIRGLGRLYYRLFAAHYFKAISAFREVVTDDLVASWIRDGGRLCVVDVGCGAGAASAAIIETVRQIIVDYNIPHSVHVHIIGVDPTKPALELYRAVLDRIRKNDKVSKYVQITHEFICEKILDGALELQNKLETQREKWDQPYLPHTILLQVNIVRPLAGEFGDVVKAYHQVFVATPMDRIHSLTIGTKTNRHDYETEIRQMQSLLEEQFTVHEIESHDAFSRVCKVINPENSEHKNTGYETYDITYHSTFSTIRSETWQRDEAWLTLITPENIKLAWARARYALLRESLVDEAEIRLFDQNVESCIGRLQRRLITYAEDIVHPKDHVSYEVPKNLDSMRPKSLSRFEEEILSVAIIQAAGSEYAKKPYLYAFRLNQVSDSKSEFLYEFWGDAYDRFVNDVLAAVRQEPNGMVIRTDLASYYTHISQNKLKESLASEMRIESNRVRWLLDRLLNKVLHPDYHKQGFGLAQGGVGSGYFANVYLTDIDDYFTQNNPWGVRFFRYADDMVIVVPEKENVDPLLLELDDFLSVLDLQRSESKTEIVPSTDFVLEHGLSPELKEIRIKYNVIMKTMWVIACHYHQRNEVSLENLYDFLEEYRRRLQPLGLVVSIPMLRRKLVRYLRLPMKKRKLSFHIELPEFGEQTDEQNWANSFVALNQGWVFQLAILRDQLEEIVLDVLSSVGNDYGQITRDNSRRLRFSISRLCQIGMTDRVLKPVSNLLKYAPNQLREPSFVLDCLSIQGHCHIIFDLYGHYAQSDDSNIYMKAMLLRAMRQCPNQHEILISVTLDSKASIEQRLMASESLLAQKIDFLSDTNWAKINNILSNESLIPRLRKNLILLMRQIHDRDPKSFEPNIQDDPILFDAFDIVAGQSIFTQSEPNELMDYFDSDYPDDAYEYGELMTTISY